MNRPDAARQFANEVVQRLQAAGFDALFAGGCVRDQLMGHPPKDFDVATSARPDEIRQLFGLDRTLAIGVTGKLIQGATYTGTGTVTDSDVETSAPTRRSC